MFISAPTSRRTRPPGRRLRDSQTITHRLPRRHPLARASCSSHHIISNTRRLRAAPIQKQAAQAIYGERPSHPSLQGLANQTGAVRHLSRRRCPISGRTRSSAIPRHVGGIVSATPDGPPGAHWRKGDLAGCLGHAYFRCCRRILEASCQRRWRCVQTVQSAAGMIERIFSPLLSPRNNLDYCRKRFTSDQKFHQLLNLC